METPATVSCSGSHALRGNPRSPTLRAQAVGAKRRRHCVPTQSVGTRSSGSARGFTLVEMMVVLTIMAVLTTMCVPSFERAIEQSRADIAAANLRAIWSAERLYWLEYQSFTSDPHLETLQNLGVLDKAITSASSGGGYDYEVTGVAPFEATATSQQGSITITIDENGELQYTGITAGLQ